MAEKYNELSTAGWAVVNNRGNVLGSESDNESGEQSDFIALEDDVVRYYHHNSSISKDVVVQAATEEENDQELSESAPVISKESKSSKAVDNPDEPAVAMKEDISSSEIHSQPGNELLDQGLVVPKLDRGMSISDVIEDNVRARLNISRSRLSESISSTNDFLLDEIVKSKDDTEISDEGSDATGEVDLEKKCDVIENRVQDVNVSAENHEDQLSNDSESDFEHLSQDDIPEVDQLEFERNLQVGGEQVEEILKTQPMPSTSMPTTWLPSLFQTTSDDSDSSKLFHPRRGQKGIRKRCTSRRSRHSSFNTVVAEETDQNEATFVRQYSTFFHGKSLYILLFIFALITGYYIGSHQIKGRNQNLEQGQTQRLHALQDELLTCLSSEEIYNTEEIHNIETSNGEDAPRLKSIDHQQTVEEDRTISSSKFQTNEQPNAEKDILNLKPIEEIDNHQQPMEEGRTITSSESQIVRTPANKDSLVGGDWLALEDAIEESYTNFKKDEKVVERKNIKKNFEIPIISETDEIHPMEDKTLEYEARLSDLESHYKEMQELYKKKPAAPEELIQGLYDKILVLENQLKLTTEALESKPKEATDNPSYSSESTDSSSWMNILSFESLKSKIDDTVMKPDSNMFWSYYDKTKEAIDTANKATMDAIGKVYDYTKSEEFASNVANTQQKFQDTLNTVNDAMTSQWETVKQSSKNMASYVKETGKNAKDTLAQKSEEVKKSISTIDIKQKWQDLKNFTTSANIMNKTKSTLHDLSEKVAKMTEYTQSDEFKSSVSKTKDSILESLDGAVQNTKESMSGLRGTLSSTWSTVKSKANDNWEAVKEKTGLGKKKKHKNVHDTKGKNHKKKNKNKKNCNKKRKNKNMENEPDPKNHQSDIDSVDMKLNDEEHNMKHNLNNNEPKIENIGMQSNRKNSKEQKKDWTNKMKGSILQSGMENTDVKLENNRPMDPENKHTNNKNKKHKIEAVNLNESFDKITNREKRNQKKKEQKERQEEIGLENGKKGKKNKKKNKGTPDPEDIDNIYQLLTGNWKHLYGKYFTMNCNGDYACIEEQRDDAEILMQELWKYNEWLVKNNYKKDANKIQRFFNELWPLVNGEDVDDQMLGSFKASFGNILKSMHQRAKMHREQFADSSNHEDSDFILRKDGRRFAGSGFHVDDDDEDWYSKRLKRNKDLYDTKEEENNYDWFTLRGIDRERTRQDKSSIDGDWFLRRGKDREDFRKESDSQEDTADWYFKWTKNRDEMRTGLSMWDLYNWFHDWHEHRYYMRQ